MNLTAEELEEKPVVFALAQQPHALHPGELIATLWPLMCFSTGNGVNASVASFRSNGYARWYRVPQGDWQSGDLVIGTLRQNERGHGQHEVEWYQVYADAGEHAGGRVCELFVLPNSLSTLKDFLRRPIIEKRIPRGDVYFRCADGVVGPFRATSGAGSKSNQFFFTPERSAEGEVDVFDLQAFDRAGIAIIGSGAVLSSNEFKPTDTRCKIYRTQYHIFRKQDLEEASLEKTAKYFLTDELLISKACGHFLSRKASKLLKDELTPLVAKLGQDSSGLSEAVIQGLPELLGDAERRIAAIEPLVAAVIQDETIEEKVKLKVQAVVQERAAERAEEIEQQAVAAAAAKLAELKDVESKIKSLRQQKTQLEKDLAKLREKQEEAQTRADKFVTKIDERLKTGRDELLTELALFAPLFQNNGTVSLVQHSSDASGSNGLVAADVSRKASELSSQRQLTLPSSPAPTSPSLAESKFVDKRLWPMLCRHGASTAKRDAELFHATMLASHLVEIPHPGWASGYAAAMGETACCTTITTSPKWLDFDSAFSGSFATRWRQAVSDPTRLHLIVLEGIDRCPTHAWLRPWLNMMAGWSKSLPDEQQTGWPSHIRLCVTEERSKACFEIPSELRQWILSFEPKATAETIPDQVDGHLPMDTWRLGTVEADETFDGYIRTLELPRNEPFTPYRMNLAMRLRAALLRLNPSDELAVDNLISWRLFACWNEKEEA